MKDIIQISTGSSNVLLVSLPEDAIDIQCSLLCHNLIYFEKVEHEVFHRRWYEKRFIKLPPGNWIEVGWSDSLSEEQFWEIGIPGPLHWRSFLSANNIKEKKFVLRDNK